MATNELPADVLVALRDGNTIEAIKLLRNATGLGLKDTKDLLEEHLRGNPASISNTFATAGALPVPVQQALRSGHKIEAIKLLREHTGMDLKAAKEALEAAVSAGDEASTLSPGEVASGAGRAWLWLVLGLAAIIGYCLFGG